MTGHVEHDNIRDSSFNEDLQKEHDGFIEENDKPNNSTIYEPFASAKPTDKTGPGQQEELFKTPDHCLSHRTHTPGSAIQEEESTLPYGMSVSKEASRTSIKARIFLLVDLRTLLL